MKLTKRGRFRNAGTSVLVDGKMEPRKSLYKTGDMYLQGKGTDNGNNYVFNVELSDEELMAAVRFRLEMKATSRSETAVGEGACATIEALLAPSPDA